MKTIKEKVADIIETSGTNNPFEIASQKNITVLYENLGDILGFYNIYKRIKFIHINNKLEEHSQFFVCAHELGHVIVHPEVNTPFLREKTFFSIDRIEIEAHTFAVELLLPDEYINEYRDTHLSMEEIADIYGVPRELIRLKNYEC